MTIGDLIRTKRAELGLTLEEIGRATGVTKSTVKKWENGSIKNIGHNKISALANILQINPAVLVAADWTTSEWLSEATRYSDYDSAAAVYHFLNTQNIYFGEETFDYAKQQIGDGKYFNCTGMVSLHAIQEADAIFEREKAKANDLTVSKHKKNEPLNSAILSAELNPNIKSIHQYINDRSYILLNPAHTPPREIPITIKEAAPAKVAAFNEGKGEVIPEGSHDERKALMSKLDDEQE